MSGTQPRAGSLSVLQWILPSIAVLGVIGFVAASGSRDAPPTTDVPLSATMSATDISALSPDERVDRLFNRVMSLASAGKTDSVDFFAPMATSAFAALEPLSLHRRYDLGLVHLVSGDLVSARAQADSILAPEPKHLLGLALAMRTANAAGDAAAARRFGERFKAALTSERARGLPEYSDHASDIDDAVAEAAGRPTSATFTRKP